MGLGRRKNLFEPRVVVHAPSLDLVRRFDTSRRGACEDTRERFKNDDPDYSQSAGLPVKSPDRIGRGVQGRLDVTRLSTVAPAHDISVTFNGRTEWRACPAALDCPG